jgi:hypothetical protein
MKRNPFTQNPDSSSGAPASGPVRLVLLSAWLILVLYLLPGPDLAVGEGFVTENPYKVEAAFLRNFAHYVTWPADAFANARSPWRIGILGRDPFGDILEKTFKGRTEQGRTFEIFRAETLDKLPPCQIIFVAYKDAARRRAALAELKHRPVLTVGDAPGFLREGGIIRFQVGDYMEMSVNLDQARSASLKIQTKMLEVTREVVENGVVRRRR